jgi:hypothetical protein
MFKKILLRGFLTVFVLVFAIFALFLIVNWGDEALRPEVQAELNWQPPKVIDEDNGYLLLLGLNAKEGVDPLTLGKRKLAAELSRYEANRYSIDKHLENTNDSDEVAFVRPKSSVCEYSETANCVKFYLSRSVEQESELLKSHQVLLTNFDRLKTSSSYIEIIPPHIEALIPSYSGAMFAAELERMRAIRLIASGKSSQGLDELLQLSAFSQRWLENADSLVSHMIALANVQKDLRIVEEVLQLFPELLSEQDKIVKWLRGFSNERMNIATAFQFERRISMHSIQGALAAPQDEQDNWWQGQLIKLFNRPNAALNLTYDWHTPRIQLLQKPIAQYLKGQADLEAKEKALLGFGIANIYLRDPIIKILLSISSYQLEPYIERHHDTFAQINLLALKLEILKQNIAVTAIPKFVQEHATQFPNPYDGKALGWDADKQQLFVELRQASNQLYQKSKFVRLDVLPRPELSPK